MSSPLPYSITRDTALGYIFSTAMGVLRYQHLSLIPLPQPWLHLIGWCWNHCKLLVLQEVACSSGHKNVLLKLALDQYFSLHRQASGLHQSIVLPFWTYKTCIPTHIRHTAVEDARHNHVFHVGCLPG